MRPRKAASRLASRRGARIAAGAALAIGSLAAAPAEPPPVPTRVIFAVRAPATTPAGSRIWISGNAPELGSWNGAGLALAARGGALYVGEVRVPRGTALEYKVTRGGWETVEKGPGGEELANRRWTATRDDTVRVEVAAWRDQVPEAPKAPTASGDIRSLGVIPTRHVRPREVLVWLPPGYDADTTLRYPVLYFHDGNNVFDAATSFAGEWTVDETADRLIRAGRIPPFIAVAVANTRDRMKEYTWVADRGRGGRGADYARFLIEDVKPRVDSLYRTKRDAAHTGVVGSSLGGLISMTLGLERPEVFGLVGAVSPTAWWGGGDVVRRAARAPAGLRVWIDIGTAEGGSAEDRKQAVDGARALADTLRAHGYADPARMHFEVVEGAPHNEQAWAARIDRILTFLLAPGAASGAPKSSSPR